MPKDNTQEVIIYQKGGSSQSTTPEVTERVNDGVITGKILKMQCMWKYVDVISSEVLVQVP